MSFSNPFPGGASITFIELESLELSDLTHEWLRNTSQSSSAISLIEIEEGGQNIPYTLCQIP